MSSHFLVGNCSPEGVPALRKRNSSRSSAKFSASRMRYLRNSEYSCPTKKWAWLGGTSPWNGVGRRVMNCYSSLIFRHGWRPATIIRQSCMDRLSWHVTAAFTMVMLIKICIKPDRHGRGSNKIWETLSFWRNFFNNGAIWLQALICNRLNPRYEMQAVWLSIQRNLVSRCLAEREEIPYPHTSTSIPFLPSWHLSFAMWFVNYRCWGAAEVKTTWMCNSNEAHNRLNISK